MIMVIIYVGGLIILADRDSLPNVFCKRAFWKHIAKFAAKHLMSLIKLLVVGLKFATKKGFIAIVQISQLFRLTFREE